jgi:phenylpropionate dioxygenase-like ring-hydroxylating dioxygenase large terminal subunit
MVTVQCFSWELGRGGVLPVSCLGLDLALFRGHDGVAYAVDGTTRHHTLSW